MFCACFEIAFKTLGFNKSNGWEFILSCKMVKDEKRQCYKLLVTKMKYLEVACIWCIIKAEILKKWKISHIRKLMSWDGNMYVVRI